MLGFAYSSGHEHDEENSVIVATFPRRRFACPGYVCYRDAFKFLRSPRIQSGAQVRCLSHNKTLSHNKKLGPRTHRKVVSLDKSGETVDS